MENQRITKKGFRYEILPLTENSPRRVKDYNEYCTLYNRLAELEDKIENGTLIELHKDSVVLSREKYEAYKKLAEAIYEEGAFNHYDNVINSAKIMFKDRKKLVKDTSKETAEKLIKLIEFHSISRRDKSGYETFTISNLCLKEILREEFSLTDEELENI